MRDYPKEDYERKKIKELGLKINDWKIKALRMNPDYNCWGNYESYMCKEEDGWDSPAKISSVNDLWELDNFNELVQYYFFIYRANKQCEQCEGSGMNKETKQLYDDWYDFDHTGRRWCENITQDEVQALWDARRLTTDFKEIPTADEVNNWAKKTFGHDSINHMICVKRRAERLGVYGDCNECKGKGYIYTEDKTHLALQMWFLHPRKGCSRGVILENIEKEDFNIVIKYLKEAQKRFNDKFNRLEEQ